MAWRTCPLTLICLRTTPGEAGALLQDLLISVTNFFRDADCFAALDEQLGEVFKGKGPNDTVRVWVAACADRRGGLFASRSCWPTARARWKRRR